MAVKFEILDILKPADCRKSDITVSMKITDGENIYNENFVTSPKDFNSLLEEVNDLAIRRSNARKNMEDTIVKAEIEGFKGVIYDAIPIAKKHKNLTKNPDLQNMVLYSTIVDVAAINGDKIVLSGLDVTEYRNATVIIDSVKYDVTAAIGDSLTVATPIVLAPSEIPEEPRTSIPIEIGEYVKSNNVAPRWKKNGVITLKNDGTQQLFGPGDVANCIYQSVLVEPGQPYLFSADIEIAVATSVKDAADINLSGAAVANLSTSEQKWQTVEYIFRAETDTTVVAVFAIGGAKCRGSIKNVTVKRRFSL